MKILDASDAGYIGSNIRDYIHISDLVESHAPALDFLQVDKPSEVFNLGSTHGFLVQEVIDTTRQVTGRGIKILDALRHVGDPSLLVANSSQAQVQK
jgi:UDP-glucose 4-epimerase